MMCQIGFSDIRVLLSLSKIHFKRGIVSCIFYNVVEWSLTDLPPITQEIWDCKLGKKKNNDSFILRHLPLSVGFFFFVSLSSFFSLSCLYASLILCSSMLKDGRSHYSLEGRGTTWSLFVFFSLFNCFVCLFVLFLSLFAFFVYVERG